MSRAPVLCASPIRDSVGGRVTTRTGVRATTLRATARRLPLLSRSLASVGDGLAVRASTIPGAGDGLFATRVFERGELITWMEGEEVGREEAVRRRDAGLGSHLRTLVFGFSALDARQLKPAHGVGAVSWANHPPAGVRPKAAFLNREDDTGVQVHVFLKAVDRIEAGEEIFVSYGLGAERDHGWSEAAGGSGSSGEDSGGSGGEPEGGAKSGRLRKSAR